MNAALSYNIQRLALSPENENIINELKASDSDGMISVEKAKRDEGLSIRVNGVRLSSAYAALKEAGRGIDSSQGASSHDILFPVFIGSASINKAKLITSAYPDLRRIFIFAANVSLLQKVLEADKFDWLDKTIISSKEDDFISLIEKSLKDYDVFSTRVFINERQQATAENFEGISKKIKRLMQRKTLSAKSGFYFAPLWSKNAVLNSRHPSAADAAALRGMLDGKHSALICAGGPTLDESIETIKRIRKEVFLISLGNPLLTLKNNGILPDLIVSTDGGFYSSAHLFPFYGSSVPIAAALSAYPSPLRHFSRCFFFSSGEYAELLLAPNVLPFGMEASVIIQALKLAAFMGARDIILAAADFSFPDERSHSKASYSHLFDVYRADKVKSLSSLNLKRKSSTDHFNKAVYTEDYNSNAVASSQALLEFKQDIEKRISRIGLDVSVLSAKSARLKNIPLFDQSAFLAVSRGSSVSVPEGQKVEFDYEGIISRKKKALSICDRGETEKAVRLPIIQNCLPYQTYTLNKKDKSKEAEALGFIKTFLRELEI